MAAPAPTLPAKQRRGLRDRSHAWNWRVLLLRLVANAAALAVTAVVLPGIAIKTAHWVVGLLILAVVFGLLNAFVKPLLQFLLLPFVLETFGLVVLIVDTILLWLLSVFASRLLHVSSFGAAVAGGALLATLSFGLDQVLGTVPPVVSDDEPAGRRP